MKTQRKKPVPTRVRLTVLDIAQRPNHVIRQGMAQPRTERRARLRA